MFAGRFVLGPVLKRGNGSRHLPGRGHRDRVDVVVKSIDAQVVHAAARLRFEHETRVLRQLSGSGLAELYASGEVDNRLYLVQPARAGPDPRGRAQVRPVCRSRPCSGSASTSPGR